MDWPASFFIISFLTSRHDLKDSGPFGIYLFQLAELASFEH